MYEIINVRGDSVRVKCDDVLIDVIVSRDWMGKLKVTLPKGVYVDNFRTLVAKVLDAWEEENGNK